MAHIYAYGLFLPFQMYDNVTADMLCKKLMGINMEAGFVTEQKYNKRTKEPPYRAILISKIHTHFTQL